VTDYSPTYAAGRLGEPFPADKLGTAMATVPDADLVLILRGGLDGTALESLGSALDDAMRSGATRVYVDLSGVTHWSLLAQAMVLATARRMAGRGSRLVLRAPSPKVRRQGRRLDIFNRVTTVPATKESSRG
jgi:anti-anti-sigma regulatory factor